MKPAFEMRPHKGGDKTLTIIGPGDLWLSVDFDDVDPDEVMRLTTRMLQVLNKNWPDTSTQERARHALLDYMEAQSEFRWSAGWLTGLETALLGDDGYEWLVEEAGGWYVFEMVGDNWRRFVPGTLEELRRALDE